MGGSLQGRLYPRTDDERRRAEAQGYDVSKVRCSAFVCVCFTSALVCEGYGLRHVQVQRRVVPRHAHTAFNGACRV